MAWTEFWKRVRRRRPGPRLGGYENLAPFGDRDDFFTATRVFPAEPETRHTYLIRAVAERNKDADYSRYSASTCPCAFSQFQVATE